MLWAVQTKLFKRDVKTLKKRSDSQFSPRQVMEEVADDRRQNRFVSTLEGKQISTLGTTVSEPILHGATTRRMGAPARHLQRRVLGRAMFKDTSLEALPPLGKMSLGASDNFARAIAVANTAESDSDQEDPETLQVSRAPRAKLAHPLRRTAEMGKIVRQMRLEASMPPVRQNFDESEAREYAKVMLRPRVRTAPSAVYSRGGT